MFRALSQKPHRGLGGGCQHPGSPGCPQQDCKLLIFSQLFLNNRAIFSVQGRGPAKLARKALGLGLRCWGEHMISSKIHW